MTQLYVSYRFRSKETATDPSSFGDGWAVLNNTAAPSSVKEVENIINCILESRSYLDDIVPVFWAPMNGDKHDAT